MKKKIAATTKALEEVHCDAKILPRSCGLTLVQVLGMGHCIGPTRLQYSIVEETSGDSEPWVFWGFRVSPGLSERLELQRSLVSSCAFNASPKATRSPVPCVAATVRGESFGKQTATCPKSPKISTLHVHAKTQKPNSRIP